MGSEKETAHVRDAPSQPSSSANTPSKYYNDSAEELLSSNDYLRGKKKNYQAQIEPKNPPENVTKNAAADDDEKKTANEWLQKKIRQLNNTNSMSSSISDADTEINRQHSERPSSAEPLTRTASLSSRKSDTEVDVKAESKPHKPTTEMTYQEKLIAYQKHNSSNTAGSLAKGGRLAEELTPEQLNERQMYGGYIHKPPIRDYNPITETRSTRERSLKIASEQNLTFEFEKLATNIISYPEDPALEAAARTILIEYVKKPNDLHPDHLQLNEKSPEQLSEIKNILELAKRNLPTIRPNWNFTYIQSDINGAIRVLDAGIEVVQQRANEKK